MGRRAPAAVFAALAATLVAAGCRSTPRIDPKYLGGTTPPPAAAVAGADTVDSLLPKIEEKIKEKDLKEARKLIKDVLQEIDDIQNKDKSDADSWLPSKASLTDLDHELELTQQAIEEFDKATAGISTNYSGTGDPVELAKRASHFLELAKQQKATMFKFEGEKVIDVKAVTKFAEELLNEVRKNAKEKILENGLSTTDPKTAVEHTDFSVVDNQAALQAKVILELETSIQSFMDAAKLNELTDKAKLGLKQDTLAIAKNVLLERAKAVDDALSGASFESFLTETLGNLNAPARGFVPADVTAVETAVKTLYNTKKARVENAAKEEVKQLDKEIDDATDFAEVRARFTKLATLLTGLQAKGIMGVTSKYVGDPARYHDTLIGKAKTAALQEWAEFMKRSGPIKLTLLTKRNVEDLGKIGQKWGTEAITLLDRELLQQLSDKSTSTYVAGLFREFKGADAARKNAIITDLEKHRDDLRGHGFLDSAGYLDKCAAALRNAL